MMDLSIIMPSYNRARDLQRTLKAYERQWGTGSFEIIVVDDASTDDTSSVLKSYIPQRFSLRAERMERNMGQGQARNLAIPLAKAPLVMFVGDDILPEPGFVEGHLAAHRCYPGEEAAILGRINWPQDLPRNTLMKHIDGIGAQQFSFYYLKPEQEYDFRHFYTSNISLKRALLHRLDAWFDPAFTMYGYEDAELGYRLSKLGMRIRYSDVPVANHYHYYNVYTFATRQYRSGLMAHTLVNKHPELAEVIFGKGLPSRSRFFNVLSRLRPVSDDRAAWLEAVTLRLASYYELNPHLLLDQLYLKILFYFFYKGLLVGAEQDPDRGRQIGNVYAGRFLTYTLEWFLPQAPALNISLPEGFGADLQHAIKSPNPQHFY